MTARADKKTRQSISPRSKNLHKNIPHRPKKSTSERPAQIKKVHVKAPRTNQKSQHQNVTSKPKSRPKMISLKSTPACVKKD